MKTIFTLFIILSIFTSISLLANTDNRDWELASGEKFTAALISYDVHKDLLVIKKVSGETINCSSKDLGAVDKAWLQKFTNLQSEMAALLKEVGGKYEQKVAEGENYLTNYYVYYPTAYKTNKNLPLILLFHPGGQGQRFLKRHIRAAEKVGAIVMCPDIFRNVNDLDEWRAFEPRFEELYDDIQANIEYDKSAFCMGGSSGGALRAYQYAAYYVKDCYGIYANGGWLRRRYDLNYPAMRVAMINGHKDKGANNYVKADSDDLKEKGSTVKLFVFEGGHQVAPTDTQFQAMLWMLEEKTHYKGLTADLEAIRKTVKFDGDKNVYSAPGVHEYANNIFTKLDFKGMTKETVLAILGNPGSLNEFSLPKEKELNKTC
ncbi:MAG: hypothetical protein NE334_04655 [Lentisphaeraceae bacterium]|nr:hypothetical protein [Lentisphaeraceae bacterium]